MHAERASTSQHHVIPQSLRLTFDQAVEACSRRESTLPFTLSDVAMLHEKASVPHHFAKSFSGSVALTGPSSGGMAGMAGIRKDRMFFCYSFISRPTQNMRLRVRCVYHESEELLELSVGDGRRTFKWLGLVAAQRFAALSKPSGRRRQRETTHGTDFSTSARLLPCRVHTSANPFCHPDNLLVNEVRDGEEVVVVLSDKMAVDGVGQPAMDRWQYIAFETSEHRRGHRQQALEEVRRGGACVHDGAVARCRC
jgi:hypothetical protein